MNPDPEHADSLLATAKKPPVPTVTEASELALSTDMAVEGTSAASHTSAAEAAAAIVDTDASAASPPAKHQRNLEGAAEGAIGVAAMDDSSMDSSTVQLCSDMLSAPVPVPTFSSAAG